jgi:hypothetical protein
VALKEAQKQMKIKGRGHEKDDLNQIMFTLESWSHRLFPKLNFPDFLEKMEMLGKKKIVSTYVKKIRLGMTLKDDGDFIDDEVVANTEDVVDKDFEMDDGIDIHMTAEQAFDKLFEGLDSPRKPDREKVSERTGTSVVISNEQADIIERKRKEAMERRLAKLEQQMNAPTTTVEEVVEDMDVDKIGVSDDSNDGIVDDGISEEAALAALNDSTGDSDSSVNVDLRTRLKLKAKIKKKSRIISDDEDSDEEKVPETATKYDSAKITKLFPDREESDDDLSTPPASTVASRIASEDDDSDDDVNVSLVKRRTGKSNKLLISDDEEEQIGAGDKEVKDQDPDESEQSDSEPEITVKDTRILTEEQILMRLHSD